MASFYDSASIITIPSGYKAGTLYSQIPTDGAGDMAFTRTGDTATRVNSAGIIERCITNAIVQSENFTSASWGKTRLSVTGDATTAPNGTTTADKLVEDSATGTHFTASAGQNIGGGGVFSVYAKASERSRIAIRESTTTGAYAAYNLSTGAIIDSGSGAFYVTITNAGSGWYRLQMVYNTSSNVNFGLFILDDAYVSGNPNSYSYTGNGTSGLFVWGAQLQLGDQATNYIPTTTAAVTQGPVTNLPRLDYFGSTCPQLLMEPTRTNLALYSQMFGNNVWTKDAVSVSENVAVSPDGYTNADIMVEDTALSSHRTNRSVSWVSGTTYAASCFVKQGSGDRRVMLLMPIGAFGTNLLCNFNLQTGVITTSSSSITGKIENYGNGWYRCIAFATTTTTSISSFSIYLRNSDAASTANYTGNGTSSMYVWGAQVEAGAYATSYIPTTAATVTRNIDLMQKTSITSLIGQTEGVLFIDFIFNRQVDTGDLVSLNDGTVGNRVFLGVNATNNLMGLVGSSSITQAIMSYTISLGNRYKCAIAYKANDFVLYVNGVQAASDTSGIVPASLTRLSNDAGTTSTTPFEYPLNQLLVFKTRLSNADLATLTTL